MKKYLQLIGANTGIIIAAVILYSPGILCLRVTDYSIFRAGMSIIAALALISIFFLINIKLLKQPIHKLILPEDVNDLDKAKSILKSYGNSSYFKSISETAIEQLDQILKCQLRLSEILKQKFTEGTISWDKFHSVISCAESSAIKNVVAMTNQMQLFDEKEYTRLIGYQKDDIPDDIQKEHLHLYRKNYEGIKSMVSLNEKILLKLNALAMELSSSGSVESADLNNNLLNEIEKLIAETKYYQ